MLLLKFSPLFACCKCACVGSVSSSDQAASETGAAGKNMYKEFEPLFVGVDGLHARGMGSLNRFCLPLCPF